MPTASTSISPHYRRVPSELKPSDVRLLLCYKNFAAGNPAISHIGLGVSAHNTAKVLMAHGVKAVVRPVRHASDILDAARATDATHVVIAALWVPPDEIVVMCGADHGRQFAVNCHSNVGFLAADPRAMKLLRQYIDLEQGMSNFAVCANSAKGASWARAAYQCPCEYLANLYYLDYCVRFNRPQWSGGTLRIGAFGATRPLKNLVSAAGAALVVANDLRADDDAGLPQYPPRPRWMVSLAASPRHRTLHARFAKRQLHRIV